MPPTDVVISGRGALCALGAGAESLWAGLVAGRTGIGPAAGRLASDLAIGAAPIVDPVPFRWSRFQGAKDGSEGLQRVAGPR